jgi:hypothetical protein
VQDTPATREAAAAITASPLPAVCHIELLGRGTTNLLDLPKNAELSSALVQDRQPKWATIAILIGSNLRCRSLEIQPAQR